MTHATSAQRERTLAAAPAEKAVAPPNLAPPVPLPASGTPPLRSKNGRGSKRTWIFAGAGGLVVVIGILLYLVAFKPDDGSRFGKIHTKMSGADIEKLGLGLTCRIKESILEPKIRQHIGKRCELLCCTAYNDPIGGTCIFDKPGYRTSELLPGLHGMVDVRSAQGSCDPADKSAIREINSIMVFAPADNNQYEWSKNAQRLLTRMFGEPIVHKSANGIEVTFPDKGERKLWIDYRDTPGFNRKDETPARVIVWWPARHQ